MYSNRLYVDQISCVQVPSFLPPDFTCDLCSWQELLPFVPELFLPLQVVWPVWKHHGNEENLSHVPVHLVWQVKCAQYWPAGRDSDMCFMDTGFRVTLASEEQTASYTLRKLDLENTTVCFF